MLTGGVGNACRWGIIINIVQEPSRLSAYSGSKCNYECMNAINKSNMHVEATYRFNRLLRVHIEVTV